MQNPLQITQRGTELDETALSHIRERAEELDRFDPRLTSCHVVCEAPHRHRSNGIEYDVKIHLGVPGRTLVVERHPNEDLNVAIRDAFDAARRLLEDAVRVRDDRVKTHENGMATGRVGLLFRADGYGFIRTEDDRDVYFHRNSVLDGGFHRLERGMEVRFAEESGEKGPQASTVAIAGA